MDLNMTCTASTSSKSKDGIILNSNSSQNILQSTISPLKHKVCSFTKSEIAPKNVEYLEGKEIYKIENKNCSSINNQCNLQSVLNPLCTSTPVSTLTSERLGNNLDKGVRDYTDLSFQNTISSFKHEVYPFPKDEVSPPNVKYLERKEIIYKNAIPFDPKPKNSSLFRKCNFPSNDIKDSFVDLTTTGNETCAINCRSSDFDSLYSRPTKRTLEFIDSICTVTSEEIKNITDVVDYADLPFQHNTLLHQKDKVPVSPKKIKFSEGNQMIYKDEIPFTSKLEDDNCSSSNIQSGYTIREPSDRGYESFDCNIPESKSDKRQPSSFLAFNPICTVTSESNIYNSEVEDTYGNSNLPNLVKSNKVEVVDLTLLEENEKLENNFNDNFKIENIEKEIVSKEKPVPFFFNNLIEMFDHLDLNILLALCKDAQDMNLAIDNVLLYQKGFGDTLKNQKENTKEDKLDINKVHNTQLNILKEILVDADPVYLESVFNNMLQAEQSEIDSFINNALEKKNFPLKQSQAKRNVKQKWELYNTNFNVEQFCNEITEPLKYFTEVNDGSSYKNVSLEYLKMRYSKISVKTIKEQLERNGHNLTKTFMELKNCKPNLKYHRHSNSNIDYSPESFKEICFLKHEEEISRHLNFMKAMKNGDLLECNCCYDNEVSILDIVTCNDGHLFCKKCVSKGVEVKIGEGVRVFSCLTECDEEFSLQTLEKVLTQQLFAKVERMWQSDEIKAANIPDIEDCPFCEYMGIPILESMVFTCLNPECGKESCRKCHSESHIPLRCDEVEQKEEVKLRTFIEDKMTAALIRRCYKCKKEYIKDFGCNKISCSCGALQCYLCQQPIKDYSHFAREGEVSNPKKCPLYSTDKALHVDAVVNAAKLAKEALKLDTELKHDPTKILPELKKKTTK